jgi:hypothetical protein
VFEVQGLDVERLSVLDGGEVGHHAAVDRIAVAVRGAVVVDGQRPRRCVLEPYLRPHQAEQGIHVVSLAQEQRELALLERREQPLGELLPLHGRDADGGVLLRARPDQGHDQEALVAREGRAQPGVGGEPVGGRDVGDGGEVHRLVAPGPRDVEQELLGDAVGGGPVVGHHGAVERDPRRAGRASRHQEAREKEGRDPAATARYLDAARA